MQKEESESTTGVLVFGSVSSRSTTRVEHTSKNGKQKTKFYIPDQQRRKKMCHGAEYLAYLRELDPDIIKLINPVQCTGRQATLTFHITIITVI